MERPGGHHVSQIHDIECLGADPNRVSALDNICVDLDEDAPREMHGAACSQPGATHLHTQPITYCDTQLSRSILKVTDGGGVLSTADWLESPACHLNPFAGLRRAITALFLNSDTIARLRARMLMPSDQPFWSPKESAQLRNLAVQDAGGDAGLASIPEGQPYLLFLLRAWAIRTKDCDVAIVDTLLGKLRTGDGSVLPASGVWPEASHDDGDEALEFLVCQHNLKSARLEPAKVLAMFQEEAKGGTRMGTVESLEEAYAKWGKSEVAVSPVGIVKKDGKADRPIIHSTASGLNSAFRVCEKAMCPSLRSISEVYEQCEDEGLDILSFSADIKGAHMTMRVHEQHQGRTLVRITSEGKEYFFFFFFFFYKVLLMVVLIRETYSVSV